MGVVLKYFNCFTRYFANRETNANTCKYTVAINTFYMVKALVFYSTDIKMDRKLDTYLKRRSRRDLLDWRHQSSDGRLQEYQSSEKFHKL